MRKMSGQPIVETGDDNVPQAEADVLRSAPDPSSRGVDFQKLVNVIHVMFGSTVREDRVTDETHLMSQAWNAPIVGVLISGWLKGRYKNRKIKSAKVSNSFKEIGNKQFKMKRYAESMDLYTKSAIHAPEGGNTLAIALANRSAALFYLKRYQDCLKDICSAIELNYPPEMEYKLYLRMARCYIALNKNHSGIGALDKAENSIKNSNGIKQPARADLEKQVAELRAQCSNGVANKDTEEPKAVEPRTSGFKENPEFPAASEALSEAYSVEKGVYVIANRPIEQNEVLFVEEPVAFTLVPTPETQQRGFRCARCITHCKDTPIPCNSCTETFYCSTSCMRKAWSAQHRWMCLGYTFDMWKTCGVVYLAVKALLTSATTLTRPQFNRVQKLMSNMDKFERKDRIYMAVAATVITRYLAEYTDFFSAVDVKKALAQKFSEETRKLAWDPTRQDADRIYFGCLLLEYIYKCITNGHTVVAEPDYEESNEAVLSAVFPSISKMNHSCVPNTKMWFVNGRAVVMAVARIPCLGEVFGCYGAHYLHMPKEQRQKHLEESFKFKCDCPACTSD